MSPDLTFTSGFKGCEEAIDHVFADAFTGSEGAAEGALIADLACDLMRRTPGGDLFVFSAKASDALLGSIIFSRLTYPQESRSVFVLGPVAVLPSAQGRGVGQALLRHGLAQLAVAQVDVAITYGDPAYYAKVGFAPITEDFAAAPFRLQHPEGWLAQSLSDDALTPLQGPCTCVDAFNEPAFW